MADFEMFVKLGYMSKWSCNHSGGTVCEPTDIPVNKRPPRHASNAQHELVGQ